jgi:hypothetical protein
MSSETGKLAPPTPWIISPNGICEVYANLMHITWSLDDVRIRLAQIVANPSTPTPGPSFIGAAEERAAITVSWRTAKLMRDNLSRAIEHFEKLNGAIRTDVKLPPSIP